MKWRVVTSAVAGLFVVLAAMSAAPQGVAEAASSSRYQQTQDGLYLSVVQKQLDMRTVPPLDSSPTSRDVFLRGSVRADIKGPRGFLIQGADFESGYEVGYPVSFAATGISVQMSSPSITLGGTAGVTGGTNPTSPISLNAGVSPSVTFAGPSVSFTVEHGGIKKVALVKSPMSSATATADFSGVQMTVQAAVGPVTIRQYTKMTVRTSTGSAEVVTYGPAWKV